MSSNQDPIVYAIIGFFGGFYYFFNGFKVLQHKRLIENTPTSTIRGLAMGLAEIKGKAEPAQKQILKSPFSGSDCVYYSYTIEEYRNSGKNSHWVTIKSGNQWYPFFVRDDTGAVLIDPAGAEVDIPADHVFNSGSGNDAPLEIVQFLNSQNLSSTGLFGWNKKMRYTEFFVAPGDHLYILGSAIDNPYVAEGQGNDGCEDIMIAKGDSSWYYIADKSEKECVAEESSQVIWKVWGGAVLTLVCLAYILFRAGMFN
jgi:hypothetical protein